METKKILLYSGGAIVLGAVTFFVWSFFQKPKIIGNTTINLGDKDKKTTDLEDEDQKNTDLEDKDQKNTDTSNDTQDYINKLLKELGIKT